MNFILSYTHAPHALALILCLVLSSVGLSTAGESIAIDICDDGGGMDGCNARKALERKANVYVPDSINVEDKVALVINIHALMSNPAEQASLTGFNEIADDATGEDKFIVTYPQGYAQGALPKSDEDDHLGEILNGILPSSPDRYSFNGGGCCNSATSARIDEIKFFRKLIDYIRDDPKMKEKFILDNERIYVTGMSNGGFMTNRVACEMSDIVAAVAPVAGPMFDSTSPPATSGNGCYDTSFDRDPNFICQPKNPVPLLHIHGSKDFLVPIDGLDPIARKGSIFDWWPSRRKCPSRLGFPPVERSINFWRRNNKVQAKDDFTEVQKDIEGRKVVKEFKLVPIRTQCKRWTPKGDDGAVVEYCFHDSNYVLGHCWPSEVTVDLISSNDPGLQRIGNCFNGIGSKYIWDFLKEHKRTTVTTTGNAGSPDEL